MSTVTRPSRRSWRILALGAVVIAVLVGAAPAFAHDSTDGSILVTVGEQRIVVSGPVPFSELGFTDTSGDGLLDGDELSDQQSAVADSIVGIVRDHVQISVDGHDLEIVGAGIPSLAEVSDGTDGSQASEFVTLVLASDSPDGVPSDIGLTWTFDSPSTTVVLAQSDTAMTGELSDTGVIGFSLDPWSSATSFFALGIDHIQHGPDHLLFLLVLTLAVAGVTISTETTWKTVKLVTAFTVGHAISLGLAYFDVISVPATIVEPLISLSIVAAAFLVIMRRTADARIWIVGLIGLVHGLGFASSLDSLGIVASQRVTALAAFNVGIDIAQTIVVLLVIGALWLATLAFSERTVWLRTSVAAGAGLVGVVWTASRVTELFS